MNFKIMTKATLIGIAMSAGLVTTSAIAADGKALFVSKSCVTCHGNEGKKPILSTYPKLNGQNKDYLIAQIKMIKDGTRSGGGTAAMKAMVATLTDKEIESISDYLSKVE